MQIGIEIPFEPVPWAAPKLGRGRVYDPRERDKRCIRYLVREQYCGPVLEGIFSLHFKFTFPIPPSTSKKRRENMLLGRIIPTRCDCTNLQKLYEDCLKDIVIKDDRHVEYTCSRKFYGEKPSVTILITGR